MGTAGFTYPTHFDCYPNFLANYWGEKSVWLLDMKAHWLTTSRTFDILRPLNLESLLQAIPSLKPHVRHVTLRAGDVLYIPALWMHGVTYEQATFSSNHFYKDSNADIALCEFIKGHGPTFLGGMLQQNDIVKAVQMSMQNDAPQTQQEFSKRFKLAPLGDDL